MRTDARSKNSSSTSEDADEGRFHTNPNPIASRSPPSDSDEQVESPPVKSNHGYAEVNCKAKPRPSSSKNKKRRSEIDLEELLAQTYPKKSSKLNVASGRSSRKKQAPVKAADSAKKWTGEEEICVARALLKSCSPEGELNMAAYYQRAKEALPCEITNSQLYDKMRNMSKRFRSIEAKLKEQSISAEMFAYRTPQEPELFKIWKQIWGNNGHISEKEAENPNEGKAERSDAANGNIHEDATGKQHNILNTRAGNSKENGKEEQTNLRQTLAGNNLKGNDSCSLRQSESEGLEKNIQSILKSAECRLEVLIDSYSNRLSGAAAAKVEGGTRNIASSWFSGMKEVTDAVYRDEEYHGLGAAQSRDLQQKWRKHRIEEVKMLSEWLELLQQQCSSFLKSVETSNDGNEA